MDNLSWDYCSLCGKFTVVKNRICGKCKNQYDTNSVDFLKNILNLDLTKDK